MPHQKAEIKLHILQFLIDDCLANENFSRNSWLAHDIAILDPALARHLISNPRFDLRVFFGRYNECWTSLSETIEKSGLLSREEAKGKLPPPDRNHRVVDFGEAGALTRSERNLLEVWEGSIVRGSLTLQKWLPSNYPAKAKDILNAFLLAIKYQNISMARWYYVTYKDKFDWNNLYTKYWSLKSLFTKNSSRTASRLYNS